MTKNISAYTRKQNIKNVIDKVIAKTFNVILYPLRYIYKHKYDGSDLQKNRKVKKIYKKLKDNIYKALLNDWHIYITDFYVGNENGRANIIPIGEEYNLINHSGKSAKVIFDEIEDILIADGSLLVESVNVRDVFKYGCYRADGRVIKVRIVDRGEN